MKATITLTRKRGTGSKERSQFKNAVLKYKGNITVDRPFLLIAEFKNNYDAEIAWDAIRIAHGYAELCIDHSEKTRDKEIKRMADEYKKDNNVVCTDCGSVYNADEISGVCFECGGQLDPMTEDLIDYLINLELDQGLMNRRDSR